jgi:hypothetical protein
VSAIEYRRCLAGDDDDRPFIGSPEESGIPELQAAIREVAQRREAELVDRLTQAYTLVCAKIDPLLKVIEGQWQEQTRASEEAERLREELQTFLEPLRAEFQRRQGAYREFLKETVPQLITRLVVQARESASRHIRADLKTLETAHWATLRAAVRRDGTFFGARHIALPRDFALRFEEPIAEVWGKDVLREIRRRTKQFADDCVSLVDQVVDWCRERGAEIQMKVVESQRDAIRAEASSLQAVGREMPRRSREVDRLCSDRVTRSIFLESLLQS